MEALETKMDVKFDSIQKQIDQLSMLFYWGFSILITLFIFMFGYMIWDRRTALQPALDKATDADAKSTNLIRALREYSKKHADLAEILRTHGILQRFKNCKLMNWKPPTEKDEQPEDKQVCKKCGNDTFRVYINIIIDDARLYCAKCGEYHI